MRLLLRGRVWLAVLLAGLCLGGILVILWAGQTPATPQTPTAATGDPFVQRREAMVQSQIRQRGVREPGVLKAMETVPRHLFVPPEEIDRAYADHPLPIGYGQTISQPYIVAVMTELLHLQKGDRVLEIGTGSGYQAAVLAELVDEVYTMEIIPQLCEQARERLKSLGYGDITVRCADGYYGWEEKAPFDAIIVTAAPDHIPQPLVNQLADGGRMVIPVGPPGSYQVLWRLEKQGDQVTSERVMDVIFVPLTGEH
ncbi:MAG: protein-L-isoaspartate(D-aspartate) O-methyltransferase [Chloroflexi bacterium]|nr:protein-L-isoaspartate(D-aspartate) O-methyltransferase [Chloroflexota bacterium]